MYQKMINVAVLQTDADSIAFLKCNNYINLDKTNVANLEIFRIILMKLYNYNCDSLVKD